MRRGDGKYAGRVPQTDKSKHTHFKQKFYFQFTGKQFKWICCLLLTQVSKKNINDGQCAEPWILLQKSALGLGNKDRDILLSETKNTKFPCWSRYLHQTVKPIVSNGSGGTDLSLNLILFCQRIRFKSAKRKYEWQFTMAIPGYWKQ